MRMSEGSAIGNCRTVPTSWITTPFWCSHGWLVTVRAAPSERAARVPDLAGRLAVLVARRDAEAAVRVADRAAGMVVERLAGKATPQVQRQRNWSALPAWRRYAPAIAHPASSTLSHDAEAPSKRPTRAGMPPPEAAKPPGSARARLAGTPDTLAARSRSEPRVRPVSR